MHGAPAVVLRCSATLPPAVFIEEGPRKRALFVFVDFYDGFRSLTPVFQQILPEVARDLPRKQRAYLLVAWRDRTFHLTRISELLREFGRS